VHGVLLLQMVMPKFPVIIKIGHAYAGIGKVRVISQEIDGIENSRSLNRNSSKSTQD